MSANAQLAAAAASPLLARIANLRSQLADLLRNGVTAAERPRLWRLRLRLALAFRDLIRAQIAVLRQGGVSAAEQARLASLLAQLRKLDARVALLRKIDRLFRGGVTASEHAKLDALIQQFAELKASTPLPPLSSVTAAIGVRVGASATASSAAGGTTTGGVAGAATTLTGTTASSGSAATDDTSPGNSEFGHSHKKPKKPHRSTTTKR
jgi:hypothetical protein